MEESNKLKAIIKEEDPSYQRGNKIKMISKKRIRRVVIRNIYSRRLEDLTFNDLEMIGYSNPNVFVKEWIKEHGSFDKDKVVWVVVYVDWKGEDKK